MLLLIANLVLLALSLVWLGPAASDVHDIAGPQLRGLGIGVYFFAVIIAYGIGSLIIGQINDWLGVATTPSTCASRCCSARSRALWRLSVFGVATERPRLLLAKFEVANELPARAEFHAKTQRKKTQREVSILFASLLTSRLCVKSLGCPNCALRHILCAGQS